MATPRIHEGKLAIVTGAARSTWQPNHPTPSVFVFAKGGGGADNKGTAGIGAAIATNLAEKGAHILIGYLTEGSDKPAAELAQELASKHNVIAVPCRADISTPEGAKAVVDVCKEKFPANSKTGKLQIDIIINSAAVMPTGPVEGVTPEEFQKTYATNVLGPILLVGQAKPYLPTDRSGTYSISTHCVHTYVFRCA